MIKRMGRYEIESSTLQAGYSKRALIKNAVKLYEIKRASDGATMTVTSSTKDCEIRKFAQGGEFNVLWFYNQADPDGEPRVDYNFNPAGGSDNET